MKLFHLLGFTNELVTRLNFLCVLLGGSRFFKEPAGIACHSFEVFSRSCISLE